MGLGVRSLVVLLNNGFSFLCPTSGSFTDIFGYELNEATQLAANAKCYQALEQSEGRIKEGLLTSVLVNHFDETAYACWRRYIGIHNCSNELYTICSSILNGAKVLNDAHP